MSRANRPRLAHSLHSESGIKALRRNTKNLLSHFYCPKNCLWNQTQGVIFLNNLIYLFLAVLGLCYCEGFLWLWSTGSRAKAEDGLSCSEVCGIFLGLNLCLLHWQVDFLPPSHRGSPGELFYFSFCREMFTRGMLHFLLFLQHRHWWAQKGQVAGDLKPCEICQR